MIIKNITHMVDPVTWKPVADMHIQVLSTEQFMNEKATLTYEERAVLFLTRFERAMEEFKLRNENSTAQTT